MSTLTQNDAINTSLAIITAMMRNDKQTREFIYEDLDNDDLKRVVRWTARQVGTLWFMSQAALMDNTDSDKAIEAWEDYAKLVRETAVAHGDQP